MITEVLLNILEHSPSDAVRALEDLEAIHAQKTLQLAFSEQRDGGRWGVAHVGEQPAALVTAVLRAARLGAAVRAIAAEHPLRPVAEVLDELSAGLRRA